MPHIDPNTFGRAVRKLCLTFKTEDEQQEYLKDREAAYLRIVLAYQEVGQTAPERTILSGE